MPTNMTKKPVMEANPLPTEETGDAKLSPDIATIGEWAEAIPVEVDSEPLRLTCSQLEHIIRSRLRW